MRLRTIAIAMLTLGLVGSAATANPIDPAEMRRHERINDAHTEVADPADYPRQFSVPSTLWVSGVALLGLTWWMFTPKKGEVA